MLGITVVVPYILLLLSFFDKYDLFCFRLISRSQQSLSLLFVNELY